MWLQQTAPEKENIMAMHRVKCDQNDLFSKIANPLFYGHQWIF